MPKSAKKRKDKAADFAKAKLKLGKGKQLPSNAIDTSFKARSIALPSQSITADKNTDAPTTKKRLAFDDLVVHLKHYSPGTRKDGIAGLRELLDAHPEIIETSLTTLINATARLVSDEDALVRRALLEFFTWLFPRIPSENLIPHSTTLLLFTTSAQTHIFPEIRVDAIRFLNLYLEYLPAATVTGWDQTGSETGGRILEGYLGLLSAGTKFGDAEGPMKATSTASVVLTSASKLVVLQSLSKFLHHAVHSSGSSSDSSLHSMALIDTWYLAPCFSTQEAYTAFDHALRPRHTPQESGPSLQEWKAQVDLQFDGDFPCPYSLLAPNEWTLQQLSQLADIGEGVKEDNSSFITHLARTLHSTLVSTFLDCAPAVFSPNGSVDETQAKLVVAVGEITTHLYGAILRSSARSDSDRHARACEDLRSILGYMAPYFPFSLNGSRDVSIEQLFQALNLVFCELTALLILASESGSAIRRGKRPARAQTASSSKGSSLHVQTEQVSRYVVQLLKGEALSTSQLGRPLTPAAYMALLPTIWSFINNADPRLREISSDILLATIEHASKVSSKSALKQATVEFMGRIILLDTEPQFTGHLNIDPSAAQQIAEWVNHLPKCLWELGATNLTATEIILRFLVTACQRRSRLAGSQTLRLLQSQMVPFFSITHPTRGQIIGPYSKLPLGSPVRRLVLSLVALLGDDSALTAAVSTAVLGTPEQVYWANILSNHS